MHVNYKAGYAWKSSLPNKLNTCNLVLVGNSWYGIKRKTTNKFERDELKRLASILWPSIATRMYLFHMTIRFWFGQVIPISFEILVWDDVWFENSTLLLYIIISRWWSYIYIHLIYLLTLQWTKSLINQNWR